MAKIDVQKTHFAQYLSFLFTLHWHQNQATDGDKKCTAVKPDRRPVSPKNNRSSQKNNYRQKKIASARDEFHQQKINWRFRLLFFCRRQSAEMCDVILPKAYCNMAGYERSSKHREKLLNNGQAWVWTGRPGRGNAFERIITDWSEVQSEVLS